ncbi:MAG: DUF5659 domain-containing protein [Patescibacteria group bacterium]
MNKIKYVPYYEEKDFFYASLLYGRGQKLENTEWDDRGVLHWIFEDEERCKRIINQHINGELRINSKNLEDALRTIKGMLKK